MADMVTADVLPKHLLAVCRRLSQPPFQFEQLIDLCGVDYLEYGTAEWRTDETTLSGFSRGVELAKEPVNSLAKAALWGNLSFTIGNQQSAFTFASFFRARAYGTFRD